MQESEALEDGPKSLLCIPMKDAVHAAATRLSPSFSIEIGGPDRPRLEGLRHGRDIAPAAGGSGGISARLPHLVGSRPLGVEE